MKNFTRNFLGLALLLLSQLGSPLFAQTAQNTLTSTTLAAALSTSNATVLTITSATGITVSPATNLYIDKELMSVKSVSGTQIGVTRGMGGTTAMPHINTAVVLAGRPNWFSLIDPAGGCTNANVIATPLVNIKNGNQWLCSTVLLKWVPGFGNYDRQAEVTTAVASANGVIVPSGPIFHVTGANAITGFTVPVGYGGGDIVIIPDGTFTWTAAGNIALAGTAVVSKAIIFKFDTNAAKPFFPVNQVTP
jgi:hypothetical protein